MPGVPHECLISQANSLEKKGVVENTSAGFFTDCRVSVSKTHCEYVRITWSWQGLGFNENKSQMTCSFSMWNPSLANICFLLTWTSTWGFDIFKCLLSVSSRDWVYKDHAINVSSLKKKLLMSFPLNKLSGTKKIEMFMAMVYSFCIVTSHLFRYKMEKSWKILQFGDISTKDHSAVGAALLLMRLPSLLIKPIASCRSLTRFVKIITFALDSCIFGGFRKSMYRYPCFGIHG